MKIEVAPMGNIYPYPMYFTLSGKDGKTFQKPALTHDGKPLLREFKPVQDNFANGVSELTVAHTEPLAIGDTIVIQQVPHTIDEITEKRKPKGSRFPKGCLFYALNCSYVRFIGQTV